MPGRRTLPVTSTTMLRIRRLGRGGDHGRPRRSHPVGAASSSGRRSPGPALRRRHRRSGRATSWPPLAHQPPTGERQAPGRTTASTARCAGPSDHAPCSGPARAGPQATERRDAGARAVAAGRLGPRRRLRLTLSRGADQGGPPGRTVGGQLGALVGRRSGGSSEPATRSRGRGPSPRTAASSALSSSRRRDDGGFVGGARGLAHATTLGTAGDDPAYGGGSRGRAVPHRRLWTVSGPPGQDDGPDE